MANHKRKRPKNRRAGCFLCKPWKMNGFAKCVFRTSLFAGFKKNCFNTHFRSNFEEVLGDKAATALLRHIEFHSTPKHASWLNMAEIEIGILERQYLGRRLKNQATITLEVRNLILSNAYRLDS